MTAIICGSLAYDNIMVFPGRFSEEILPERVHALNVAFLVPEMRKQFGGCAANIAYALGQLGGDGKPMGTVGMDFGPYTERLTTLGIDQTYVKSVPDAFTAQAFITTDLDDNQITAFHPGAMNFAHEQAIPAEATLGIVAPDGRDGMIQHATQFAEAGVPFIFDPGQGLPMFDGDDLKRFIEQATHVAVNDYEQAVMTERTGWQPAEIAEHVEALIVTRGAKGSEIYTGGCCTFPVRRRMRSSIPPDAAMPTGAGCFMVCKRAMTGRRPGGSHR